MCKFCSSIWNLLPNNFLKFRISQKNRHIPSLCDALFSMLYLLYHFRYFYMGICAYIHIIMLENKVKFFKALSDGTRLTILSYLLEHGYCACDFSPLTEKDQSTVSKHLKVLAEAGILKSEKSGRNIIYTIRDEKMKGLLVSLGIKELKPCCSGPKDSPSGFMDETEDK
jgi:DNA-binding transcriptional ArsR family regulator